KLGGVFQQRGRLAAFGGFGRTGATINAAGGVGMTAFSTTLISVAEGALVELQAVMAKAVNTTAACIFTVLSKDIFDFLFISVFRRLTSACFFAKAMPTACALTSYFLASARACSSSRA
ncbi:hypothetical protein NMEN69166_1029, partial [Neisseria meningitidis 69166]